MTTAANATSRPVRAGSINAANAANTTAGGSTTTSALTLHQAIARRCTRCRGGRNCTSTITVSLREYG
ncbi:hypothetical protein GCM10009765_40540 [Fodinicola feengrottensis]|uniref:Uncharacterized protein n=1 Tax=Fodinicola feengrottensis TaxID=435914 RepID=A0ABP4TEV9_9ACTN